MTRVVRVLFAFLLLTSMASMANAATTEFRVLFDVDNDPETGCEVNGMEGVEQVLVTQVTDGTPTRVTRTHRQVCMGVVLGSPMDINTEGWNAGWNNTNKLLTVETRIPFMAFGSPDMPSNIHAAFDATRTPSIHTSLLNSDGTPVEIPPPPVRRRTIGVGPDRHIVMDGSLTDWGRIKPIIFGIANGGTNALRVLRITAWPDPNDHHVYFAFTAYLGSDHPYADDDVFQRNPGQSLAISAPGVLDNDGIPGNAPLSAQKVSDPERGTVTLNSDGSFTYSPTHPQLLTSDEFEYRAVGSGKESNVARVIIKVNQDEGPNSPNDDEYTTLEDTTKVEPAPGVLANDPHTNLLVASLFQAPDHGTVVVHADGGFTYTPDDDFFGTDSFVYTATKKQGAPEGIGGNATVTIFIVPVNDEPSFEPGPSPVTTTASSGPFAMQWATDISAGPDESDQAVNFVVTNNNNALFAVQPAISPTGTLTFTPAGSQGTATVSVRLEDNGGTANGGDDTSPTVTFTIIISCGTITVTNPATNTATVGTPFSQTFTQTGAVGTATFTTTSTLPAGLTLATNGVLSGTPTEPGTFPITVTVTDSTGCIASGPTYNLVVNCQTITVTNPANANGTAASPFSETFTQVGGNGATTFSLGSGTLPAGLTFAANGVLSGTPTQTGSFPITVVATDANGCTGTSATYTIVIACQIITVTNPANGNGTAASPFSETFTQTGGIGTTTFSIASGTLPAGLTLAANGVLSGTPTQTGSFPITVTATDSNGCTGTGTTYSIVIACQTINVSNPANTSGTVSAAFSETFTQTGAIGTATFTTASTLPTGITLAANGVLSGTPLQTGSFPIVVTVTDSNGCTGTSATYTLVIACQTITVTNPVNTGGTVNAGFSETFTQTGAVGTVTFSLASGVLPAGLTLAANGTLSGTPTEDGSFPITVTATDVNGCTGTSATYNLVIACQTITVTNPSNATGPAGSPFSETFTQTGAFGSATFTTASTLPTGLSLSTAGVLSGTPGQGGTFPIVVTVTDANGCTGTSATYNLVITCPTITVTNPANSNGTASSAFSETFTQTGGIGTTTFSLGSGTLPAGLTLAANGVLSGTPTQTGSFPITVVATDSNGCTGTGATYTIVIGCQTITVNNPANGNGTAASPFSETFTHTAGIGTTTFTLATGTLPAGLTLAANGVLSGTPTQTGSFPITVTATDSNGCTGTGATYTIVIGCQVINVVNPSNTSGTVSAAFSETFTQTGAIGTATFTTASTLPAGLTLAANGVLSGTPTQPGTFPIVVTVTDANGCTGTSATYNLVIGCQTITVTNPANTGGTVNAGFSETFTQSGAVGTATFTTASTLPAGLTLAANGVLSGTPTQPGTFPIVVTVTDANGCTGTSATYTLVIACQTITVTNPSNATGPAGTPFSETFTQTGAVGTATFTTASTLPTGLTLSTAGVLSGTPTQGGTFPIVVTVTDSNGCTGTSATYNLVITCPVITVTNPANTSGTAGSAFSETFTQTGGQGTVTFTTSSTLPAGLTLSTAGVLSGTPTQTGTFPIVVVVTDQNGCIGTGSTYNLVIACQVITVNNPANANGTAASPFSETFTAPAAIGTTTFTLASGTLPAGMSLASNGTLSGTPTQVGSFPITVTATDSNGCTGTSATYTLVIGCQVITVNSPANASGTVNAAFSETFTQTGAIGAATFTTSSTLPAGLTLSTAGVLSGTPTEDGTFPIVVVATDSNGCTGTSATYNLVIACQTITVTNPANANGTVGTLFSETFTQVGALGSATFTTASTLPAGITLSTAGVLSGTPTQSGSFPIVVTVTDSNGCTGTSATYNLVIACQTITVTNPGVTSGTVDVAFSQTFTQTGAIGTATFTTSSTLPSGLTLSTAGVLSGTPGQPGTFPIVVTVTDSNGCTGTSATYTLVIACQTITVTNPGVTNGTVDSPFSQTFTQTGVGSHTPATFTTSSTLPSGLTLATNGTLSGTPGQPGTFPIVVTVTDVNGCSGTGGTYNLVIACQVITVTNPGVTAATYNVPFSQTFTQTGVGTHTPANFTTSSTLPAGLTLASNGTLSGTPTQTGTFPIVVTVTDVNGCTGTGATYTLSVAPVANADSYSNAVNNTQLVLTGGTTATPSTPSVQIAGTIVTNDQPSGNVTVVPGVFSTTGGGSVTVAADGTFLYTPPALPSAAALTSDTFTYTVTSNTGGTGPVTSAPATVTINLANRVWYVKNDSASGGDGRSHQPFDTLAEAQTASTANDYIFVYNGNNTSSGQDAGITLKAGQRLYGQGIALTVNSQPLVAAGTQALIANTGGAAVTATNITGVEVRGLNMTASTDVVFISTSGASNGGVEVANNTITSAGAEGIDVDGNSSGTLTLSIHDNNWNSGGSHVGNAIDVIRSAGTLNANISNNTNIVSNGTGINVNGPITITGFSGNTIHGNTNGSGITVNGARFDATPGNPFNQVSAGTTTVGAPGNAVGGAGITLTNVTGDLNFTGLGVYAGGSGFTASSTAAFNSGTGAGLQIIANSGADVIQAAAGVALSFTTVTTTFGSSELDSSGSTTQGINLDGVAGTFTANSSSSIGTTTAAATAYRVNNSSVNATYNGTINITQGAGVSLTSNTGTYVFTGQLTLTTGTNGAFVATNSGTVSASNTSSAITTTTGAALNVSSTNIAAAGLRFVSITAGTAASGPAIGINLSNTGTTAGFGGLTIGGGASAGNGGTIQRCGTGINLSSTRDVVLNDVNMSNFTDWAIRGASVVNFTADNLQISGTNGDNDATDDASIRFTELTGSATISNSSVSGGYEDNITVINSTGVLNRITLNTVNIGANGNAFGDNGVLFEVSGGATLNATVTNCTFTSSRGDHVQFNATTGSPIGDFILSNSIFTNSHPSTVSGAGGIRVVTGGGTATVTYNISGNSINGARGTAIGVTEGAAASTMTGTIDNNDVGTAATANSGSLEGSGISVVMADLGSHTATVTNNDVRQYNINGIFAQAGGGAAASSGNLKLIVTGNAVGNFGNNAAVAPPAGRNGFHLNSGTFPGDTFAVCLDFGGAGALENSIVGSGDGVATGQDFRLRQRQNTTVRMPGYGGANNDDAAVTSYIQGRNTGTPSGAVSNQSAGWLTGACPF